MVDTIFPLLLYDKIVIIRSRAGAEFQLKDKNITEVRRKVNEMTKAIPKDGPLG
jgi:hypothetical protein